MYTIFYLVQVMSMKETNSEAGNSKDIAKAQQKEQTLSRISAFLVTYFFISYMPFILYTFTYNVCNCAISGYIR